MDIYILLSVVMFGGTERHKDPGEQFVCCGQSIASLAPHTTQKRCRVSKKSKYVTQFSCSLAIFSSHFRIWGSFFQQEHIRVLFLRCLPCCESHLSVTLSRWLSLHTFKTTLLANNFSKRGKEEKYPIIIFKSYHYH